MIIRRFNVYTHFTIDSYYNFPMEVKFMRFSTILESALQNKDRQQKELAEHLEVHASNISQYATGRTEPDFETMMKICQFLNIDLTAIYQIQHENPDAYIILDKNEKALIDTYRSLPKKLQTALRNITKAMEK